MTGKWTLPLAALAFSLTVTPFSAFAAEGDAPPPPGDRPARENRCRVRDGRGVDPD